ncbi:hypothetical protein E2C01_085356 [Portunus trituberculatus]|uniref:Uncharacterized protein n=1 Tax=Portunus trituberculatus TaxID=210409 RepID=A0A5B7J6M2_PORTR|nr:hypothetical protein [Portunus trituberculatus]
MKQAEASTGQRNRECSLQLSEPVLPSCLSGESHCAVKDGIRRQEITGCAVLLLSGQCVGT